MSHVQIYADGVLAYDNRIPAYATDHCIIDESINTGGTCTLSLFPGHPAYELFPAFRTPVTIYKDGAVRFRGRPLPLSEETYGMRTIICEGELCWLNDVVIRPYLYQTDPASIFRDVIEKYNAVVEPWKRFAVGQITVTDANDYIRVESSDAASAYDVIMQLVERCGGYIFFETEPDGNRSINWYQDLPYTCNQPIILGKNLTSYAREPSMEQFATRIIPYGASNADGEPLTINVDGKDYIQDDEAVALRGVIEAAITFDDITLEKNLITRATQWLKEARLIPETITLGAVDLSKIDDPADSTVWDPFRVGQMVEGISAPHGLSGHYALISMTEDLCDPREGLITFGRSAASLIGSDAAEKRSSTTRIEGVRTEVLKKTEAVTVECEQIIRETVEGYVETSVFESYQSKAAQSLADVATELANSITDLRKATTEADTQLASQCDKVSEACAAGLAAIMRESEEYPGCYYREVDGAVEWLNPPMEPGTVYRTTERYAGSPVNTMCAVGTAAPKEEEITVASLGQTIAPVAIGGCLVGKDGCISLPWGTDVAITVHCGEIKVVSQTDISDCTINIWVKYVNEVNKEA